MSTNPTTPSTPEEDQEVLTPVSESQQSDAARRLTEEARAELVAEGHSESQIRAWAEEFVDHNDTRVDLPGFLDWVAKRRS